MNRVVSLSGFREEKENASVWGEQPDLKFSNRLAANLKLSKTIDKVAWHILIDLWYDKIEWNPKANIIKDALIRLYKSWFVSRLYERDTQNFDSLCDYLIESPAGSCYDILLYFFWRYVDDIELLTRLFRRCWDKFAISRVFKADGLTWAIDSKSKNKVKLFLDNWFIPEASFNRDWALYQAIIIKDLEIFKMIFQYIWDVDYYDYEGKSLFLLAIICWALEIAKYLLAEWANLNTQDDRLCTAAMYCVHLWYIEMFEFLIKNHANVMLLDNMGNKLFAHIVVSKRPDFLDVFIKYNCDSSQKDIQFAFNTFLINEDTGPIMLRQLIARKWDEIDLNIKDLIKMSKEIPLETRTILREFVLERFSWKPIPIKFGIVFPDLN